MSPSDFEQLKRALENLGLKIEWVDLMAETILIRVKEGAR